MNFTESPRVIAKVFSALRSNHFEVHMELFAMTVMQYETLSDKQIQEHIGSIKMMFQVISLIRHS
jgi:hypothetical protein